jgi:hypothetical protein
MSKFQAALNRDSFQKYDTCWSDCLKSECEYWSVTEQLFKKSMSYHLDVNVSKLKQSSCEQF